MNFVKTVVVAIALLVSGYLLHTATAQSPAGQNWTISASGNVAWKINSATGKVFLCVNSAPLPICTPQQD